MLLYSLNVFNFIYCILNVSRISSNDQFSCQINILATLSRKLLFLFGAQYWKKYGMWHASQIKIVNILNPQFIGEWFSGYWHYIYFMCQPPESSQYIIKVKMNRLFYYMIILDDWRAYKILSCVYRSH